MDVVFVEQQRQRRLVVDGGAFNNLLLQACAQAG